MHYLLFSNLMMTAAVAFGTHIPHRCCTAMNMTRKKRREIDSRRMGV